jgi:tRNA U34 5-methylaminomethyl-2-thiouridine-forming methyltransferase MnmC
MMDRHLVVTGDGSHSLYVPELNEHYHSRHGALQESRHVFIDQGLRKVAGVFPEIRILEIGFGTGLNAWLTALEAEAMDLRVAYRGVEAYPLSREEVEALNYPALMGSPRANEIWDAVHAAKWGETALIHPGFHLFKLQGRIEEFVLEAPVNLIYFDAFAPEKQPELWTEGIFEKMYGLLTPDGLLTTYCAKGSVRRAMLAAGFRVQKEKGPPGKREMLVAWK